MKRIFLVIAVAILAAGAAYAQKPKYIGMKSAKIIAMREVPGTIKSAEREREHGKMIYSFDVKTADGTVTEVNIDAITGALIEKKVETAEDEAREKAGKNKEKDD